jgi:hypothetical protein
MLGAMWEPSPRSALAALAACAAVCVSGCGSGASRHSADPVRTYIQTIHPIENRLRDEIPAFNDMNSALERMDGLTATEADAAQALAKRLSIDAIAARDVQSTPEILAVNEHLAATFDGFAAYARAASRALAAGNARRAHALLMSPPPPAKRVPAEISEWRDGVEALLRRDHLHVPRWISRITVGEAPSSAS